MTGLDALAELERLRRQALQVNPSAASVRAARSAHADRNGAGEIHHDVDLRLDGRELNGVQRLAFSVTVQDEAGTAPFCESNFYVDVDDPEELKSLLLRLNIAVDRR